MGMTGELNINTDVAALMAAGQWDVAAILIRQMLADQPDDAGARILYGDCLLQLGQFAAAEQSYRVALSDRGSMSVLLSKLALLARARNRFDEALGYYQEFRGKPSAHAGGDTQMADEAAAIRAAWPRRPEVSPDQLTIIFSGLSFPGVPAVHWGRDKAFWRYAPIAQAYMSVLDAAGFSYRVIAHPEYIADAATEFGTSDCIHIRIAPPDNPRLLKGAYNILVCPATVADLPISKKEKHPFADWMTLIEAFDEIWAPTRYSFDILVNYTRAKARLAPPPLIPVGNTGLVGEPERRRAIGIQTLDNRKFIPLAVFPRIQPLFSNWSARQARTLGSIVQGMIEEPRVFLAMVVQGDSRQHVRALVEAFSEYLLWHPDALLLILYMAVDLPPEAINPDIARHHLELPDRLLETLCSDRIWLCSDQWSPDALAELYAMTHFFIGCPSIEGHSQMLVDAMTHGCVPIMPRHSGLCDIIDDDSAVVIASTPMDDLPSEHLITAEDVSDALARAGALSDEAYAALQAQAVTSAHRIHGGKNTTGLFQQFVSTLRAAGSADRS